MQYKTITIADLKHFLSFLLSHLYNLIRLASTNATDWLIGSINSI